MNRERISKRPLPPRKLPSQCLCCGTENPWVLNKVPFIAPFRDAEHEFRAEVHQCRHCDAVTTTEEQSAAISAQTRNAHQKWISEKLKAAKKELGLSLRDLAEKSGIPFATLGRVSSGEHLIEATMEKLLWMEIGKLTQAQIAGRWLGMRQREFRVTDGSVLVKGDPTCAHIYSEILQIAARPPLGNCGNIGREDQFSAPSYSNLLPA